MTKEEIWDEWSSKDLSWTQSALAAMDEYGKHCFYAGRTHVFGDYEKPKYDVYEDYLKELEDEKR